MDTKRISGFQWAMTIFVFYVLAYALPLVLKDFQGQVPFKRFVFDLSTLAPFIAAIICLIVFRNKRAQLASLKFTISFKVIERIILALILPLVICIICMFAFNTYADSFIILQSKNLSVSVTSILIGHLLMAFFVEFGFRSYLQNVVETKTNTLFASILIGILYALWNVNTTYTLEFTLYNLLYHFAFSMIIGELIRGTKGRTIYIAVAFHTLMSFGLVFFFSEELGDVFSMKVIALSTALVGAVFILLSLLIRAAFYFFTKDSLEEVEPNNPLDYPKDEEDEDVAVSETAQTEETTPVTEDTEPEHSTDDSESIKDDEPAQTKDTDEPK
ncbi:CPBP family intramembrane glutamic endopeptidase [Staphylococcus simulans]|uniref:CPBP family intramembrane glutamic endopeptidase n=1 Tax=Staphylococcus simulans TaxID=1286 RepID=UPI0021D21D47|nr:CPBP family intramembrane glutamic endopeptidase [Staphylococcus simulans]UXR35930.1 CPBP family intramembrane metalloprotease [Staphylococcus simulans]UXR50577.1 CPBP family intramembrane metalloprotease [Staphylococcus simulans]